MLFGFTPPPPIRFGAGCIGELPERIQTFGRSVCLVTGGKSFRETEAYARLLTQLEQMGIQYTSTTVTGEPSPAWVDEQVAAFHHTSPEVVVAIGGGSVLDAGKALSAMLPLGEPVRKYLEGVGTCKHPGTRIPLIAVPTTAGTGSEATKNAVLGESGPEGFKRSLRHDRFIPDLAIIDPELTLSCPPDLTLACGMDTLCQLLEAFVSTQSSPITDALAIKGLQLVGRSFQQVLEDGSCLSARSDMALAAFLSGVTLANAGLGVVHGFASNLGGRYPIPHGVVCGILLAPAIAVTLKKLKEQNDLVSLEKYRSAAEALCGQSQNLSPEGILPLIQHWSTRLPHLKDYISSPDDLEEFARISDNKNNPGQLTPTDRMEILNLAWNIVHQE